MDVTGEWEKGDGVYRDGDSDGVERKVRLHRSVVADLCMADTLGSYCHQH